MPCYTINGFGDERAWLRTRLDDVNTNILNTGIDLFLHEGRGSDVYVNDPLSILRGESSRSGHGIATMSSKNLLISFKSAKACRTSAFAAATKHTPSKSNCAYAPPELSEPAMRRTRRVSIVGAAASQVE